MDRVPAIDSGVIALGALFGFVIYSNRRLPTGRRIDDLLEEYFEGRMPVGRLARAIASREVLGGLTLFSLAASASQYATDVKRAKREKKKEETSH